MLAWIHKSLALYHWDKKMDQVYILAAKNGSIYHCRSLVDGGAVENFYKQFREPEFDENGRLK